MDGAGGPQAVGDPLGTAAHRCDRIYPYCYLAAPDNAAGHSCKKQRRKTPVKKYEREKRRGSGEVWPRKVKVVEKVRIRGPVFW